MRARWLAALAFFVLGTTPAHALLKAKPCAVPRQCTALKTALAACKPHTRCNALVSAVKALQAPTKCQRTRAADQHAFSLCSKNLQDEAFAKLSHASSLPAKRLFCSTDFKRLLARRHTLKEQYAYAYAPYDPNSEDDEVGAEKPDFFATMTDCRQVK